MAVFKGMNRDWVFDKVREYLQESAILVRDPQPHNPGQMLRYRQAIKTDLLAASKEEGRVAAWWELREKAGSAFPLRKSSRPQWSATPEPEPAVLQYLVTFKEVQGGMEIALSITPSDGTEADRLYYRRFWQLMTGRWE